MEGGGGESAGFGRGGLVLVRDYGGFGWGWGWLPLCHDVVGEDLGGVGGEFGGGCRWPFAECEARREFLGSDLCGATQGMVMLSRLNVGVTRSSTCLLQRV